MEFRTLRSDEIECRVGTCGEKGFSLLLYKDARCDMNILDESVGAENWQRRHELVNEKEFCTVSIWSGEKGMWVEKQDCGTRSNTEAEKGESSDAFKRACVNWGIGRELYSAPFIWISGRVNKNSRGKFEPDDRVADYVIDKITYDENRRISDLIITYKGDVIYSMKKPGSGKKREQQKDEKAMGFEMLDDKVYENNDSGSVKIFPLEQAKVEALRETLKNYNVACNKKLTEQRICSQSKATRIEELSIIHWKRWMDALNSAIKEVSP